MARQKRVFPGLKCVAGTTLTALGSFILYENLAGAVAAMRRLLADYGSQAAGILPAALLAAPQLLHSYATAHQWFLHGLLQQILVLFWPLLLVLAGTVLSRNTFTSKCQNPSKK